MDSDTLLGWSGKEVIIFSENQHIVVTEFTTITRYVYEDFDYENTINVAIRYEKMMVDNKPCFVYGASTRLLIMDVEFGVYPMRHVNGILKYYVKIDFALSWNNQD